MFGGVRRCSGYASQSAAGCQHVLGTVHAEVNRLGRARHVRQDNWLPAPWRVAEAAAANLTGPPAGIRALSNSIVRIRKTTHGKSRCPVVLAAWTKKGAT